MTTHLRLTGYFLEQLDKRHTIAKLQSGTGQCTNEDKSGENTKKVLLVGRTGSGKSTVATMLYKRCIDSDNPFKISDSPSGSTIQTTIKTSIDKRWEIYDTVGLGEGLNGSIPDNVARKMLVDLLKSTQHKFNYICMLKNEERFGAEDDKIIAFIYTLFEEKYLKTNMLTIFKTRDKHWIARKEDELNTKYNINTKNAIAVDLPGYMDKSGYDSDEEGDIEEKNTRRREKSLARLESFMSTLGAEPVPPRTIDYTEDREFEKFSDKLIRISKTVGKKLNASLTSKQMAPILNIANLIVNILRLA